MSSVYKNKLISNPHLLIPITEGVDFKKGIVVLLLEWIIEGSMGNPVWYLSIEENFGSTVDL